LKRTSSSFSVIIQVILFAISVGISSFVVTSWPDPEPPAEPLPEHTLSIEAFNVKTIGDEIESTPGYSIDVYFYGWGANGPTTEQVAFATTNASGVAEVLLDTGNYDIKVGKSFSDTIYIDKNATLVISQVIASENLDSLRIYSLTEDWVVTQGDIVEANFLNTLDSSLKVHGMTMDSREMNLKCVEVGEGAIAYAGAAAESREASGCKLDRDEEIAPFSAWTNKFVVPPGILIEWKDAVNEGLDISIELGRIEIRIDEYRNVRLLNNSELDESENSNQEVESVQEEDVESNE
tara:strand:- start:62 stop:940 length:879 start_codon:yes stop_codon:yes gene_type:complete